jgi:ribosome-associated protein
MEKVLIDERPIHLVQVLKLCGWAEHGGEAKSWVSSGRVKVNGVSEGRRRRQMAVGDVVSLDDGRELTLVSRPVE